MIKQGKLTYFGVYALEEPIRMMLVHAKQPFEDKRISFEEWPALKPNTPAN